MNAQTPYSERDALYRQARKRVLQLKGFYSHLFSFVVVNAGLVVINLLFTPGYLWFLWPLLGWGVGLLSHAAGVFRPFRLFSRDWEERKIRGYMEKARRVNG
jgi:hypothetical protein